MLKVIFYRVEPGYIINNQRTPLHYATEIGCFEVIKYLIEKGAILNAEDEI